MTSSGKPPLDPALQDWPDLAGRIDGERHILPIRVYFEDTDFTGFVYHGSYLRWCERARSDRLRLHGLDHEKLQAGSRDFPPMVFVVRLLEMKFKRPAHIDELLHVVTTTKEWGHASISIQQDIVRDQQLLMRANVQLVLVDSNGKPQRLTERLVTVLGGA